MAKKLKADWFAATEEDLHPKLYLAGTELTGELAARADALGLLEAVEDDPKPRSRAKRGK